MKKITKNINDSNALDFYDTLTDKQRAKFDNEKDSFTIDFVEVSNIYTNLNAEQTGILFLAISMYAATGKKSGIDEEVLDAVNADPKILIQFNNMANRVKNNTKAWINNRGQAKPKPDVEYDTKKGCWKANNTGDVKELLSEHKTTLKKLNEYLFNMYVEQEETPDIFADDFDLWAE
jgi:hypothetical protein